MISIIQANALAIPLADRTVQTCVTSPPYWGLRDYGVAGQLGVEKSPEEYVQNLVQVFREVRRVLKDDGTLWLNLGDSYASSPPGNKTVGVSAKSGLHGVNSASGAYRETLAASVQTKRNTVVDGLKPKDLVGIPWRVAFALQADGWYLRSDIIWSKPNPMPESVTDRPTKSHEYIFLLSKSARYCYDHEAVKEPYAESTLKQIQKAYTGQATKDYDAAGAQNPSDTKRRVIESIKRNNGRNRRSVWTVTTAPYKGAHFATFPPKLIEPCVLAGSRPGDLVLDPFGGSGTTGLVAQQHGRSAVLLELSAAYLPLMVQRINGERERAQSPISRAA